MRRGLALWLAALSILATVSLRPAPAAAVDTPPQARITATPQEIAQLRAQCLQHQDRASTSGGWTASRYQICHRQLVPIVITEDPSGKIIGTGTFVLWMLGFGQPATRMMDFYPSAENMVVSGVAKESLLIGLHFGGACASININCSYPRDRVDNVYGWQSNPAMTPITVTSPNDTGFEPFYTWRAEAKLSISGTYPGARPVSQPDVASLNLRFDSAGPKLGNGPYHGAVFPDHVPTFELSLSNATHAAQARHMWDAHNNAIFTFPDFLGKNIPGRVGQTPLHRLMNESKQRQNADEAKKVCVDVWGPDYARGGLDCDEFPFQSTYEGAYQATDNGSGGDWSRWHGSARPIPSDENQAGGRALQAFYAEHRILDDTQGQSKVLADAFWVHVEP